MSVKDAFESSTADREEDAGQESTTAFAEQIAALGSESAWPSNFERDFLSLARRDLATRLEPFAVKTVIRHPTKTTQAATLGVLLPHEFAHCLYSRFPAYF